MAKSFHESFSWAAYLVHTGIVEILVDAGANVNHRDREGATPLMLASTNGHVETLKLLLSKKAVMNYSCTHGWNELTLAIGKGNKNVVEVLLQHGFNVNHMDTSTGMTALMLASAKGDVELLELLLHWGAGVNQTNCRKSTALHKCAEYCPAKKCATILRTLLLSDADVRIKQNGLKSALDKVLDKSNSMGYIPHGPVSDIKELPMLLLYAAGAPVSEESDWNSDKHGVIRKGLTLDLNGQHPVFALTGLCRICIRAHLFSPTWGNHSNLITAVPLLPLPERLKDLLLFHVNMLCDSET